jgi:hypothetical protein
LYLSDLEEYLSENYVNHLEFLNENCIQHIGMYLKLFLLLYADDTIMFAESTEDLQAALNIFEECCSELKLSINVSRTIDDLLEWLNYIFFVEGIQSICLRP